MTRTKDISDEVVCRIADQMWRQRAQHMTVDVIMRECAACEKVVLAAMSRAVDHGFLEYGVSIGTAWLTKAGRELISTI